MTLATTLWNQGDGSIVDQYGNRISQQDSLRIVSTVHGLPARQAKDDFLHALSNHPIVIVQGETGSGKSTQLPKFAHFANPDSDIVVTQPRVLSATSLASRVSMEILAEMRDPDYALGKRIGYRTGAGGKLASHETRLAYHTDGTEFMRQSLSKKMPNTLFIDEVHGFSVQTEMLAMLSRYNTHAMRIVLMSATLDPEIFREYYKSISRDIPLIQIPGRTFEVEKDLDRDASLLADLRTAINDQQDVLIFVPGKKDIQDYITTIRELYGDSVEVFPLHAEMPASQQNRLLTKTSTKTRIVVATNIAEESITIPYLKRVMDLGKVKILRYDAHGTPMLCLEDTAMSNVLQRAWRAGRTAPWIYDRYSTTPSEDLDEYPTAPIEREMIDRHILTLLSHGVDIIDMIYEGEKRGESPFFHHVDIGLFQISLSRLKSIGALTNSNKLTVLGYELLKFPIDAYHARMLYESIERWCIGNMIPIVAILEKKWFVSKDGSWQDLLSQKQYSSDLDAYAELLDIVTGSKLTKEVKKKLISLKVDADQLEDFYKQSGEKKLYEVVDLTPIGIKNKKLKEVDECRTILLSLFAAMGIPMTTSTDSKALVISP